MNTLSSRHQPRGGNSINIIARIFNPHTRAQLQHITKHESDRHRAIEQEAQAQHVLSTEDHIKKHSPNILPPKTMVPPPHARYPPPRTRKHHPQPIHRLDNSPLPPRSSHATNGPSLDNRSRICHNPDVTLRCAGCQSSRRAWYPAHGGLRERSCLGYGRREWAGIVGGADICYEGG